MTPDRSALAEPSPTTPVSGREVHLVSRPTGAARVEDFRVVSQPVREPAAGEILVRNTWMSVDPSMRLRLGETGPAGYLPRFEIGAVLSGLAVGEVVASNAEGFAPGDLVRHSAGWRDFAVVKADGAASGPSAALATTRLDPALGAPEAYLGPLGMIGLTAYAGLIDVAGLREGDIVWVSGAAGAVGSLATQIAKLRGHRTIGSAGSDEKVAHLLNDLGVDAAFNYKKAPVAESLARAAPDGIDVYFDNVGGDHLEAALGAMRPQGRIALCGAIAEYDDAHPQRGPRNLFQAVIKDLSLRGRRPGSHVGQLDRVVRDLGAWLRDGRLRYTTTVFDGLDNAPAAFVAVMSGRTSGKTLVRLP